MKSKKTQIPLSAMILAGGESSRMGKDKAFLKFGARTMVENLAALLTPLFEETLVIVREKEKFESLNLGAAGIYEDFVKGRGPLAGIYTGLSYSKSQASAVFTCDMPLIDSIFIEELAEFWEEGFDVLSIEDGEGKLQPFPGIYARSSRHLMRLLLDRNEASLHRFLEVATIKKLILRKEQIRILTNMNTIEDYYAVLREKEEHYGGIGA